MVIGGIHMPASTEPDRRQIYEARLSSLHELAQFMGELAELLAHVSDALSHNPDEVDLSPGAAPNLNGLNLMDHDWPSFARLQSLQKEWRVKREAVLQAWATLSDIERADVGQLPPFGAPDPTRPFV